MFEIGQRLKREARGLAKHEANMVPYQQILYLMLPIIHFFSLSKVPLLGPISSFSNIPIFLIGIES